jgi:hypothetical protein
MLDFTGKSACVTEAESRVISGEVAKEIRPRFSGISTFDKKQQLAVILKGSSLKP